MKGAIESFVNDLDLDKFCIKDVNLKIGNLSKTSIKFLIKYDIKSEDKFLAFINAYCMEFEHNQDVEILIVCDNEVKDDVNFKITEIKNTNGKKNYARIFFVNKKIDDGDLYNIVDYYIMFGFDRSIFEAMACGASVLINRVEELKIKTSHFIDSYDLNTLRNGLKSCFAAGKQERGNIRREILDLFLESNKGHITAVDKSINIEIIAPLFDPSGYSTAARDIVMSLYNNGCNLTLKNHVFDKQKPLLGSTSKIIYGLINRNIEPDIRIFIMSPNVIESCYPHLIGKKPICSHFYWETSKIPPVWVRQLNNIQGTLAPCTYHAKILRECGVKIPIECINHVVDTNFYNIGSKQLYKDKFVFYSIFQWTERKNPLALIRAYLSEFKGHKDVLLILKAYTDRASMENERHLTTLVEQEKRNMPLRGYNYPEIKVMGNLMSSEEIKNLHQNSDCFVLLHRGEGLGLPIIEAMASGKPVIATKFYAPEDYLTIDNSYPVDYTLEPVYGLPWIEWYSGDQMWAHANVEQAQKFMRQVYNNREEARQKGLNARQTIIDKYSSNIFSEKYILALEKIIRGNR